MRRSEGGTHPVNPAFHRAVLIGTSDRAFNVDFSRDLRCLSETRRWQCHRRALCSDSVALRPCALQRTGQRWTSASHSRRGGGGGALPVRLMGLLAPALGGWGVACGPGNAPLAPTILMWRCASGAVPGAHAGAGWAFCAGGPGYRGALRRRALVPGGRGPAAAVVEVLAAVGYSPTAVSCLPIRAGGRRGRSVKAAVGDSYRSVHAPPKVWCGPHERWWSLRMITPLPPPKGFHCHPPPPPAVGGRGLCSIGAVCTHTTTQPPPPSPHKPQFRGPAHVHLRTADQSAGEVLHEMDQVAQRRRAKPCAGPPPGPGPHLRLRAVLVREHAPLGPAGLGGALARGGPQRLPLRQRRPVLRPRRELQPHPQGPGRQGVPLRRLLR